MRFLRMLSNSLLAGALGAAYLTVLVLQLNPDVPLFSLTSWWWFVTLGMLYGVHFAVLFYVAIVAREFFTMEILSPGWVSVRLLAWLGALLAAGAAVLMWLNLSGLAATLAPTAEWRMRAGAIATTASAIVLLSIAIAHYSFGRRGSRVGAALFSIAIAGSIALPIAARGPAAPANGGGMAWSDGGSAVSTGVGPRVFLILLDGGSLEYIWPRVAEGRLPNFGRILERGAVVDLATIRPTQPGPVWAAVATGRDPDSNGIRSAARYYARHDGASVLLLPDHSLSHVLVHLGFVRDVPLTAAEWGARPLWDILTGAGLTAGIVRWPVTHPAPPAAAFVVSDRLHQVTGSIGEFERAVQPRSILPVVQGLSTGRSATAAERTGLPEFDAATPEHTAVLRDRLYARIGHALRKAHEPRLFAVRFEGLDVVGHHYLQYVQAQPPRFIAEEERRRFAQVVDRYYAFIDAEVGVALNGMTPGDLVMVVSGFGMEPAHPVKKALGWLIGDPAFNGTHDRAPDGFLLAYGRAVQPGRPQRGSIVDVTPTLLYFFGLPIGRDMDGYARADLFTRAFTAERPITFIPSYR